MSQARPWLSPVQGSFGPPIPTPPRRPSARRVTITVISTLALLLAAGTVWFILGEGGNSDSGDGPGPPASNERRGSTQSILPAEQIEAALAWYVAAPPVAEAGESVAAPGVWISGDTVVRLMGDAITAYDFESGEEAWTLPIVHGEPHNAGTSSGGCGASRNADDGRIALLQGRDCEILTVVDISSGEEVVSMPLDSQHVADALDAPAILGDTVAVGDGFLGSGYSISEGRQIWRTEPFAPCPETAYTVFGDRFISVVECGADGRDGMSIRATTEGGEELWEWTHDPDSPEDAFEFRGLISVNPLVIYVRTGEIGDQTDRILVIDEDRDAVAHELDYNADRQGWPCAVNSFTDCDLAVIGDSYLYLAAQLDERGKLIVFDLETGHALYEVDPPGGWGVRPIDVMDGKLLVYQVADREREGEVLAFDPQTEEFSQVMALDPRAHDQEFAMMSANTVSPHDLRVLWESDTATLILVNEMFQGPGYGLDSEDVEDLGSLLVYR
jgi:outer membrane protein assembly factor BamB